MFYHTEWTSTLIKFLKDQLSKLQDYYHLGSHPTSSSNVNSAVANGSANSSNVSTGGATSSGTPNSQTATTNGINVQPSTPTSTATSGTSSTNSSNSMTEEQKLALKQWNYCLQLG